MEEAVYSDCRTLIRNFTEKGRPSFKSFCAEWKNLSFQHIFTNQSTYIQVQQTTACAFYLGKRILGNRSVTRDNAFNFADTSSNEQTKLLQRIGGLYLLYAIYFKQPLHQYTKIEVSLELWQEIKHFITNLLPADGPEYDEARYAFWKLFQSQAFRFTALDYCVGLEGLVDYYDLDNTKSHSLSQSVEGVGRLLEKHTNFTKLTQTTPALVALEKGYNEMKNELTKLHQLDKKLLPPTNIFQSIRESFEKIEMIVDVADGPEDVEMSSSSKRRKLKDKAYGAVEAKETSDTKRALEQENTKQQQKANKYPKICRMSARTIFAGKLPEDAIDNEIGSETYDSDTSTQKSDEEFMGTMKKLTKKVGCKKSADIAENITESDTE